MSMIKAQNVVRRSLCCRGSLFSPSLSLLKGRNNHYTLPSFALKRNLSSSSANINTNSSPLLFMWGTDTKGSLLKPADRQTETKIDVPSRIDFTVKSPITKVVCGATDTAFITADQSCYVVGENKYGQLGLGHAKPVNTLTRVELPFVASTASKASSSFSTASANTAAAAFANDRSNNTLGITQVALGPQSAAYVDVEGDLYTCGLAGSALTVGALGLGPDFTRGNVTKPTLVTSLIEDNCFVAQVVVGESHMAVLTTEGEVLTTGHGSYGRLGNLDTVDQLYLEPVELLTQNVTCIVGGEAFTLALQRNGILSGWGRNQQGQLGIGYGLAVDMYAMQALPEPIETDELVGRTVKHVSAGFAHVVCVTDDGAVYEWGMSLHLEPTRVRELATKNIVQVACGQNYTLALDDEGYVYSWGQGKTGVLGQGGSMKQMTQPSLMEALQDVKVTSVSAGWKHAACLAVER